MQVVSFKWLSRHLSIPANDAKRLLFQFTESHRGKASITYLLAGWTKGAAPQHVIKLVDASALADCRAKLEPITAMHVYSVQPTQPKVSDAARLCQERGMQGSCGCSMHGLLPTQPS